MLDETEFQFQKVKQILELKQGRRMSLDETLLAKAVFYFAKGCELKQKLEPKQRRRNYLNGIFKAVRDYHKSRK